MSLRERAWEIVEVARQGDQASRAFDVFLVILISTAIAALVLETVEPLRLKWQRWFYAFEVFSVAAFSLEYVFRLWASKEDPRYSGPAGRLRFAVTPLALADLLAVIPFYLPAVWLDLRFLRGIRLFRLFRILKLGRYSRSLQIFGRVLRAKRADLAILLFVIALLLLFSSSLMYYAEHDAQPEDFSSIPATMWWGVITLSTVGYGDAYPVTAIGRILGAFVAILGIGLFALPAGLLGAGFIEELGQQGPGTKEGTCPHCGGTL